MNWVRERLRLRGFPWAALGATALIGVAVSLLTVLVVWLDHRDSPPPCYGIGWGCTLDAGSSGAFVAIGWVYGLAILAGVLAISELFWRRITLARSVAALIVVGAAALALLYLCVVAILAAVELFVLS